MIALKSWFSVINWLVSYLQSERLSFSTIAVSFFDIGFFVGPVLEETEDYVILSTLFEGFEHH